jgi:hypothetical protein
LVLWPGRRDRKTLGLKKPRGCGPLNKVPMGVDANSLYAPKLVMTIDIKRAGPLQPTPEERNIEARHRQFFRLGSDTGAAPDVFDSK